MNKIVFAILVMTAILEFVLIGSTLVKGQEVKTLDVRVNLEGVPDRIEVYEVHVTAYGKEILQESSLVNSKSDQICSDDISTLCYVNAGVYSFPSELVPEGSKIQACVREPASELENCALGENTVKNSPEIIFVQIPYLK